MLAGCGNPLVAADLSVAEGKANKASWPWEAAIEIFYEPWCAGTLIASTWVLTTAKCIDGYEDSAKEFVVKYKHYDSTINILFRDHMLFYLISLAS